MQGTVLRTWTGASLLLTGLLTVPMTTNGSNPRTADEPGMQTPAEQIPHCAAPRMPFRRPIALADAADRDEGTALLLALIAERGRLGWLSR